MGALRLYRGWDEQRWLKWAGWWERKRADGRSRYVRWATLAWAGAMINVSVLSDYLAGRGFSFTTFIIMLPLYLGGGWLVGTAGWRWNEGRYRSYLAGDWRRRLRE